MSRLPFYVRFRGLLIGLGAVIVAMSSTAMAFWTGHRFFTILLLLSLPVFLVGFVFHFVDLFRRLRKGPDDESW